MSSISMFGRAIGRLIKSFKRSSRGNVSIIAALTMPLMLGVAGLGVEGSYWMVEQRAQQNAADMAAIAAATNGGATYDKEAKAVAALYGFQDGVNGVTVTASNTAACPAGGATCYSVSVAKRSPLYISQVVGFTGDVTSGGTNYKNTTGLGVASLTTTPRSYCILALAGSGAAGITSNGAPKADLSGCNIMSNTSATCHGHNTNADIGDAHLTNSGCGNVANSNVTSVADPYSGLASNIPSNTCSSYPQEPSKKGTALPASNQWSGSYSWSGTKTICGDLQMTGNVTITSGSNLVLVIENGRLDTNGYTLLASSGVGLTVIFSGSNGSYTHGPTGGGTLNFQAPTSGTWSGVAIYQDPSLTSGVDISAAGNSPTWDITGLVYLPHASVTFSGAVNKSSNGQSCFGLVIDNLTINGTGSIINHGGCPAAGLTLPSGNVPGGRGQLVS